MNKAWLANLIGRIPIDKSTHDGVIVTGLKVIEPDLRVVVVAAVAVGVDGGDERCIGILRAVGVESLAYSPCVVGNALFVVG